MLEPDRTWNSVTSKMSLWKSGDLFDAYVHQVVKTVHEQQLAVIVKVRRRRQQGILKLHFEEQGLETTLSELLTASLRKAALNQ